MLVSSFPRANWGEKTLVVKMKQTMMSGAVSSIKLRTSLQDFNTLTVMLKVLLCQGCTTSKVYLETTKFDLCIQCNFSSKQSSIEHLVPVVAQPQLDNISFLQLKMLVKTSSATLLLRNINYFFSKFFTLKIDEASNTTTRRQIHNRCRV